MEFKTSLDKAGRVRLPKRILKQMKLSVGDEVRVQIDGDAITVRPVLPKAILKKELGVWVYQGQYSSQSIARMIDKERSKRLREWF